MATDTTVRDPFLAMLKQGTRSAGDILMAMGIALVVLGIIALLAPLAGGLLFDILFGALLIGAGIVEFIDAFIGVSLVFAGTSRIAIAQGVRRAEHLMAPTPAHGGAHA